MRAVVSLLALLVAAPLAAQPRTVSLDEALDIAQTRTTDVLRADAQVQSARVAVDAVADRRWPSLGVYVGGGQRYGLSFDQTSGGLTQSTVETIDVGVSTEYVVFDGFARRAEARAADAGVRRAELSRARAVQQATVVVLEGYLAIAQAEAARRVAEEDVAAQRDLLAEVTAQVELGERAAYERAQQQERIATAQAAVLAATRDRALAQARLGRTLGLDPAQVIDVATPGTLATGALSDPSDVAAEADSALVRRALTARPDLRAAAVAVEAAEADGRAARAARLPQIALNASAGTSYTSAADGVGLPGQFGDNRSGGLRLGVTIPIFDRGATRARVQEAQARAALLRAEAEDARRAVELDVRERIVELDALRAQADVAQVRVEAAEAALAAERARFQAGETTLQAVSLLQARAVEARSDRARLAVEAQFQRLFLAAAVGE